MADGNNIRCADIEKLVQFETDSQDAITEFERIKSKFKEINDTLLSKWQGAGANQYKKEVDNILEKIGSVADVLDAINNGVVKSAKDAYLQLDADLAAFNENPTTEDGGES
ncbi:MAG: hypothetical protein K2M82_02790 [Lachnospiraceae bacterium]|nr:hypothetical protein [Lachnospiraceae bacterium]